MKFGCAKRSSGDAAVMHCAFAQSEVKCATHFRRNFTAKLLHNAKHRLTCRKAHLVKKGLHFREVLFWRRHPDLNRGIADLQSAALPLGYDAILICRLKACKFFGAGNETRTRYLHLGKVALYRMSYARKWCLRSELNQRHADFQSAALPTELQRRILKWWEQLDSNQ